MEKFELSIKITNHDYYTGHVILANYDTRKDAEEVRDVFKKIFELMKKEK